MDGVDMNDYRAAGFGVDPEFRNNSRVQSPNGLHTNGFSNVLYSTEVIGVPGGAPSDLRDLGMIGMTGGSSARRSVLPTRCPYAFDRWRITLPIVDTDEHRGL
jgi:hypothetical protein